MAAVGRCYDNREIEHSRLLTLKITTQREAKGIAIITRCYPLVSTLIRALQLRSSWPWREDLYPNSCLGLYPRSRGRIRSQARPRGLPLSLQ